MNDDPKPDRPVCSPHLLPLRHWAAYVETALAMRCAEAPDGPCRCGPCASHAAAVARVRETLLPLLHRAMARGWIEDYPRAPNCVRCRGCGSVAHRERVLAHRSYCVFAPFDALLEAALADEETDHSPASTRKDEPCAT